MKSNIDNDKVCHEVNEQLQSGLSKLLLEKTHKDLSKFGNQHTKLKPTILEIGAGQGNHHKFVRNDYRKYVMTDISKWGQSRINKIAKIDKRVSFQVENVEKLSFQTESFDRVICTCVLSHVNQPFLAMEEILRVTKRGGNINLYLSADPGVLLRFLRLILIHTKMKNLSVPYNLVISLEHRNNAWGLIDIAKFVFRDSSIKINYLPFRIKSWNLSTHIIVNITKN